MRTAISVLGIDIGKNVCSLVGLDASGKVVLRRRAKRETLIALAAKLPPCIVAMEACCGAHHLGRVFAARGHEVRLMSPEYVRPYIKAQKNDDRDAEGIAEAATRPTMRFVELKSQAQLDMQTLHRSRDRLVGERTALINQLRAILLERGIVVAKGKRNLEKFIVGLLEGPDDRGLNERMRTLIADMRAQWMELDRRIRAFDAEFVAFLRENADAQLPCDDPRRRPADRLRFDRGDWRGRNIRTRPRSLRLAGADTAPGDDRRQAEASRDQQARQQISAQNVDPWGARGAAAYRRIRHAARALAEGLARQGPQERRRGGARQQAGADRLGGAAAQRGVHREGGSLRKRSRRREDWPIGEKVR